MRLRGIICRYIPYYESRERSSGKWRPGGGWQDRSSARSSEELVYVCNLKPRGHRCECLAVGLGAHHVFMDLVGAIDRHWPREPPHVPSLALSAESRHWRNIDEAPLWKYTGSSSTFSRLLCSLFDSLFISRPCPVTNHFREKLVTITHSTHCFRNIHFERR